MTSRGVAKQGGPNPAHAPAPSDVAAVEASAVGAASLGQAAVVPAEVVEHQDDDATPVEPISLTAYAHRRRSQDTTQQWGRILQAIPREERLMYAGILGEEGHLIDILAHDPDPSVRRVVALHPGLTERGQWELVRDPDSTIRERLARNPCAEPEILAMLGRDLDLVVRMSVAANEATPDVVRERLAMDVQPSVRAAVRERV